MSLTHYWNTSHYDLARLLEDRACETDSLLLEAAQRLRELQKLVDKD